MAVDSIFDSLGCIIFGGRGSGLGEWGWSLRNLSLCKLVRFNFFSGFSIFGKIFTAKPNKCFL